MEWSNQIPMLELISIHIPKTAGTSFSRTLKDVYGNRAVLRINNINQSSNTKKYNAFKQQDLQPHIKVIHGHFNYNLLKSYINIPDNIPVITWLRDPVERSISNYQYFIRDLHEELEKVNLSDEIHRKLRVIEKNVVEYSFRLGHRNRMANYLKGVSLEQLFFVGIVEHYTEDLAHLAKLLHWENFQEYKVNISKKHITGPIKRKNIKSYNNLDYRLYYQAVYLRKQRAGILSAHDKIAYIFQKTLYFIQTGLKR